MPNDLYTILIPVLYTSLIPNVLYTILFFVIIFFVTVKLFKLQVGFEEKQSLLSLSKGFLVSLISFISLAFVVDFLHELGHAVWGVAVGGRLLRMQIAFLEVYPQLKLTPNFVLGGVWMEGLVGFNLGLFKLGGSLTTNILSWLLASLLLKKQLGWKTQRALKIIWLLSLLDLPFYIIFPQIGLHHWIVIGGSQPEPLIGARMMAIPDPVFYTAVVVTTLGSGLLYLKPRLPNVRDCIPESLNWVKHRLEAASCP